MLTNNPQMKKQKVCIFFINYGPYHFARVNAVYNLYKSFNVDVIGLELARQESEYPWITQPNTQSFILFSLVKDQLLQKVPFYLICYHSILTLRKINPDIVAISGYSNLTMLLTLLWCLLRKKIPILLSETTERDFRRNLFQERLKSCLVKCYKAALVGGNPHKKYLIKLGMKPEAIFFGYDVINNSSFCPSKIRLLTKPIQKNYFLTVNRFVPKKNLLTLLQAYELYLKSQITDSWHLVLSGDGELRCQIENIISELNLSSCVHLTGFLQQEELLPYFAHAQCFIHASTTEQWGLVVNEAMAAGLPVLVSNRCGCFEDLVIEGVNGFGFDPEDGAQLTQLMLKMSSGEIDLEAMGQAGLKHIQKYSPDYFAQGLKQAIDYALSQKNKKNVSNHL